MTRTVLVTGGNRGLGKETCRQLAEKGLRVVLAARTQKKAARAAAELGVEPLELDVTSRASIESASADVRSRFGKLDVLVNNAAVALDGFDESIVDRTLAANYHGVQGVTDAFIPLLVQPAVIVMVSSGSGTLSHLAPELQGRFKAPDLTRAQLDELTSSFREAVAEGAEKQRGWPSSAYSVSKVALNALTRIYARELGSRGRVNAVCPGWVRTDMGGPRAARSVEDGAKGIVWAALIDHDGPTGGFFRDGMPIDW